MAKSKIIKNLFCSFGGQIVIMILGIVVPRIMLTGYGSDVNGFVSTISQIFNYLALLEAGIGQAATIALYKPITEKNREGASYVASVAQTYFRRITKYYALVVFVVACVLPLVLKTNIDKNTIFLFVMLEGMSGVINFYFIQTLTAILMADGRGYIYNGIGVVNRILGYVAKIFMASFGCHIITLEFVYFIITIAKASFYKLYFNKNYCWINFHAAPKTAKLANRNSFILTEVSWTIFYSTDMIVLSTFVSTEMSSVYIVYNLVFSSWNTLLYAVYNSINYVLGQAYHENIDKYTKLHDTFNTVFVGGMTILMSVSYLMIIPFVRLYTSGVSDINYIYKLLPIMFCLVQILSWSRHVTGNLTILAGYARQLSYVSLIEAIMNVVLSVILVHEFGIVGVLIATVVALPFKVIWCSYMADKKVLKRSSITTIKIIGINYAIFFIVVVVNEIIKIQVDNYVEFILVAGLIFVVISIISSAINIAINPNCLDLIKTFIKKRKGQGLQSSEGYGIN